VILRIRREVCNILCDSLSSLSINRKELQDLAKLRLREAKALLGSNHPDGAYYLAGYAVECALKACIAKRTKRHDFPEKKTVMDSHTHDPIELLGPAGLKSDHRTAMLQQDFAKNWKIVTEWKAESRYASHSRQKAEDLLAAINDRKAGVLRWITQYW
jgi:HEPN domain-containing protein